MLLLLPRLPYGARRARASTRARPTVAAAAAAVSRWVGQPGQIGQNQISQQTPIDKTLICKSMTKRAFIGHSCNAVVAAAVAFGSATRARARARARRARVARPNFGVAAAVGWWVGQPGLIGQIAKG